MGQFQKESGGNPLRIEYDPDLRSNLIEPIRTRPERSRRRELLDDSAFVR